THLRKPAARAMVSAKQTPRHQMADLPQPPVGLQQINALADRASTVISRLRERVFAPGAEKRLELSFNVRTAAEMVGRTEKSIRGAEADGRLEMPEKDP